MTVGNYVPEFESLLRIVASELGAPDEGPIITDKFHQILSLPPLADFALNAKIWEVSVRVMDDVSKQLEKISLKAIDDFAAACKLENLQDAMQAAVKVRRALLKMAAVSEKIAKQGGVGPPAPGLHEKKPLEPVVLTAVALAKATVRLLSNPRQGISKEEIDAIAGAIAL